MPRPEKPKRHDETIPGGATIKGGYANPEDGKHYGGIIQDSEGRILDEFGEEEENPGVPRKKAKAADPRELEAAELRKALEQSELDKADAIRKAQDAADKLAETQRQLEEFKAKGDEPKTEAKKAK